MLFLLFYNCCCCSVVLRSSEEEKKKRSVRKRLRWQQRVEGCCLIQIINKHVYIYIYSIRNDDSERLIKRESERREEIKKSVNFTCYLALPSVIQDVLLA
jgi:hypothetical protein